MQSRLQRKMFGEMERKEIFQQVQGYVFDYIDSIHEREVFPTEQSIKNLSGFMEEMPNNIGNASDILKFIF